MPNHWPWRAPYAHLQQYAMTTCSFQNQQDTVLYLNRHVLSRETYRKSALLKALTRPCLEHAVQFCEPLYEKNILGLERAQGKGQKNMEVAWMTTN